MEKGTELLIAPYPPGSGIEFLFRHINKFLLREGCSPARWGTPMFEDHSEDWHRAWAMWEECMEAVWKEVAIVHSCEQLTEEEHQEQYGLWKDRDEAPEAGQDLQWVISTIRRPGHGWMH